MLEKKEDSQIVLVPIAYEIIACVGSRTHGCDGTNENGLERWYKICAYVFPRFVVASFMKYKSEVATKPSEFKAFNENQ